MIQKLSPRELTHHMGLVGVLDEDYRRVGNTIELIPFSALLLDNPAQSVDVIVPGDTVVIWGQTQLHPNGSIVGAEAHPRLLQSGFCSFPRLFTEDHLGFVSMLFKCEREVLLSRLPYFIKLFSLGACKQ